MSFEFFPPKTDKMAETLWGSIQTLEPLQPRFVSVTYGAGGSTRERTHATVERIVRETPLTAAAHLTCVGAARGEIDAIAQGYWDAFAERAFPAAGVAAEHTHLAGGRRAVPLEDLDDRRLPGAVGAEQRDDLAFGDRDRQAAQHEDHVVVDDLQVLHFEHAVPVFVAFCEGLIRVTRTKPSQNGKEDG